MLISRRRFVKKIAIFSSLALLFLNACKKNISSVPTNYELTPRQQDILFLIHAHLFPSEPDSPGATDINSIQYVQKLLKDPQIKDREKRLMLYGINWTNETAQELFQMQLSSLNEKEIEAVLIDLGSYKNGNRWLSNNISYILEALLSDPIYGSNTNEIGWKWLQHKEGYPRPSNENKYPYL
jgi:gluconate 2-dehydrogenase gamma chain